MRLALYRHLQTLSPRFWARTKLGDMISRINNDIAEVQRVSAGSLLSVLSNIVFLAGSAGIMLALTLPVLIDEPQSRSPPPKRIERTDRVTIRRAAPHRRGPDS
jgi:ABC-type multidrug transport system fused ATPase/permease subunit